MKSTRRSYQQHCGLARALDLVGERWTLLVVRELLLGARRFSQLLEGLPGISTNLLSERLKAMVAGGLIEKSGGSYVLTPRGRQLEPVLLELGRWGWQEMAAGPGPGDAVNVGWSLIALKRRYRGGLRMVLELRSEGRTFELTLTPEQLVIHERAAAAPEVTVEASFGSWVRVVYGGEPWQGLVEVKSGTEPWQAFLESLI